MKKCNYCGNDFKKQAGILLWDNELYCEMCLDSISPDFSQYVSSHVSLIEKGPNPLKRLFLKFLWIEVFTFIIFSTLFILSFGFQGGLEVTGIVMALQILIVFPATVEKSLRSIPIIEVKGGWITFYRRSMKSEPHFHKPLHEIKWRIGNAKDDSMPCFGIEQENVIVLEVPYKSDKDILSCIWLRMMKVLKVQSNSNKWFCYTCGWTTESKKIWLSFFELAGVECKKESDVIEQ